jgi:hypothetical protein
MDTEIDQVFVIRFWREGGTAELPPSQGWRARIAYVNDGRQLHAPGIEEAFAIVRSLLPGHDPQ